jgi:hypothetical protein
MAAPAPPPGLLAAPANEIREGGAESGTGSRRRVGVCLPLSVDACMAAPLLAAASGVSPVSKPKGRREVRLTGLAGSRCGEKPVTLRGVVSGRPPVGPPVCGKAIAGSEKRHQAKETHSARLAGARTSGREPRPVCKRDAQKGQSGCPRRHMGVNECVSRRLSQGTQPDGASADEGGKGTEQGAPAHHRRCRPR